MHLLQMLLDWCCRLVAPKPKGMTLEEQKLVRSLVFQLECAHKTLTGGRLADEREQQKRERHAERIQNFCIANLADFCNRGKELKDLPLYITRQDVWD